MRIWSIFNNFPKSAFHGQKDGILTSHQVYHTQQQTETEPPKRDSINKTTTSHHVLVYAPRDDKTFSNIPPWHSCLVSSTNPKRTADRDIIVTSFSWNFHCFLVNIILRLYSSLFGKVSDSNRICTWKSNKTFIYIHMEITKS